MLAFQGGMEINREQLSSAHRRRKKEGGSRFGTKRLS